MKILIFINTLTLGGAERQVVQDANALANRNHTVTVCFGVEGPLIEHINPLVKTVNLRTKSQLTAFVKLYRIVKRQDIDVVLSHGFWANKVAALACLLSNTKLFTFEHGLGLWRKWYHIALSKMVSFKSSAVVTCSYENKRQKIYREKISEKKLIVIHNSFDNQKISREIAKEEDGDKFKIGFAGRFNKVKQLHLLVEVALIMQKKGYDFQFILLGSGTEKENLETLAKDNGVIDNFVFHGYVPNPYDFLPNFDCFVLPSLREDFSLALLEASYAGLPCVAFDVGGNKEIVEDNQTGYIITPFDTNQMAFRIIDMINNPKRTKEMGQRARKKVQNSFSIEKRVENLENLILP